MKRSEGQDAWMASLGLSDLAWLSLSLPMVVLAAPPSSPAEGKICKFCDGGIKPDDLLQRQNHRILSRWRAPLKELPTPIVAVVTYAKNRLAATDDLTNCDGRYVLGVSKRPGSISTEQRPPADRPSDGLAPSRPSTPPTKPASAIPRAAGVDVVGTASSAVAGVRLNLDC